MKAFILYAKTGGGHISAGEALKVSLSKLDVCTKEFDALEFGGKLFSKEVSSAYINMVKVSPRLFGALYNAGDKINSPKRKSIVYRINSLYANKLLKVIEEEKPDIIICTHVFAAQTLSYLQGKHKLNAVTSAIVTDYTCAPYWDDTNLDYYFIPHKDLTDDFVKKGIKESSLKALGMPVNPKFNAIIHNKAKAKKILGYDENKPHILIMGGSMGAGDIIDHTKALSNTFKDATLTAICGNNTKLFNKMNSLDLNKNVQVLQFVTNMNELMDSADIIVTKPGGLTSTEAMDKNIPLIMINPIPGVESANCNFFEEHNTALYSHSPEETVSFCEKLLLDKKFYECIIDNQKKNSNKDASDEIVKFLIEQVK